MKFLLPFILLSLFSFNILAELKLPSAISDNMVLQRGMDVPVYGWSQPGSKIVIKFMGQTKSAVTDNQGCWKIKLNPIPAISKPQKMSIDSCGDIFILTNILVGEVWVCSGQSNMERSMRTLKDSKKEIAGANDSQIRFFAIEKFNFKPYP